MGEHMMEKIENAVENNNSDNIELTTELSQIKSDFGSKKNFLLQHEISTKQLNNFCRNCKIENADEIIALIDTTVFKSGKDGIAFCFEQIIWRNFAFEQPQSISYEDICKNLTAMYVKNDKLIINIGKKEFILSVILSDVPLEDIELIIKRVAEFWRKNCIELSDYEKFELEVLDLLSKKKPNYFRSIQMNLVRKYRIQAVSNVAEDFLNCFFAVSYEQVNDAFRRNVLAENLNAKRIAVATNSLLQIALAFPNYLKKNGDFSIDAVNALQNDYVTYEVLTFMLYRMKTILFEHLGRDNTLEILSPIIENSIVPFILQNTKSTATNKLQAVTANPLNIIASSPIMNVFSFRNTSYAAYEDDEAELIAYFVGNIAMSFGAGKLVTTYNRRDISDEELHNISAIKALFEDQMNNALTDYNRNLTSALENIILSMITT